MCPSFERDDIWNVTYKGERLFFRLNSVTFVFNLKMKPAPYVEFYVASKNCPTNTFVKMNCRKESIANTTSTFIVLFLNPLNAVWLSFKCISRFHLPCLRIKSYLAFMQVIFCLPFICMNKSYADRHIGCLSAAHSQNTFNTQTNQSRKKDQQGSKANLQIEPCPAAFWLKSTAFLFFSIFFHHWDYSVSGCLLRHRQQIPCNRSI